MRVRVALLFSERRSIARTLRRRRLGGVEGHPFWSDLDPDARRAVLEYLKTL